MSTLGDLTRLFAYNRWATQRILDAADALAPEELTREIESSFPSVRATLVHAMGAEWVWLERWRGRAPTALPDGQGLDSVEALRARWEQLWREQQDFLAALPEGDVARTVSYRLMNGDPDARRLDDLMRHVVNHATYHRGQVVTMLRQLGKTPPSTDYVRWLRDVGRART
jgi:uncharacterized damage-inducible protein DinB